MMQKRIYLGMIKHNQIADVRAVPVSEFKKIAKGVIISRKQYRRFMKSMQPIEKVA